MIIEKNALYQILQSAFSSHHPKFPWPKRHDLEDQTIPFQVAFSEFSMKVNEAARAEIIAHKEIERDYYVKIIEKKDREINNAKNAVILPWLIVGVMIGAFILGFVVGI
jgi:hypothetical protein